MAGLLTPGQRAFAGTFARETGLNPHVVGAWMLAEESGSAAAGREHEGNNNWLNIAMTDSGPAHGSHSSVWHNPHTAGLAAAEWMRGRGQIAREYGAPSSGIQHILNSHGSGPDGQISAIANSGWASSGYNGGNTLRQLYSEVSGENIPMVKASPASAGYRVLPNGHMESMETTERTAGTPGKARIPGTVNFNEKGFQEAREKAEGLKQMNKLNKQFGGSGLGYSVPLPSRSQFTTRTAAVPGEPAKPGTSHTSNSSFLSGAAEAGLPNGHGYVSPINKGNWRMERTDMGVDAAAYKNGEPIRAIGNGKVLGIEQNWYSGQPYLYYQLLDGPMKGKVIYVAEGIRPQVKPGEVIRAGRQIGTYNSGGTGIEMGFGTADGKTLAQSTTGYTEGAETQAGKEYRAFLNQLR